MDLVDEVDKVNIDGRAAVCACVEPVRAGAALVLSRAVRFAGWGRWWSARLGGSLALPVCAARCVVLLFIWVASTGCGQSIHDAAMRADLDAVAAMLDADPELIAARDPLGKTPLHQAVTSGSDAMVSMLIARGADVNAADNTGMTPLHVAAWWTTRARASLLLEAGADLDARDSFGNTPLHEAALQGRVAMTDLLIGAGADVEATNLEGLTPLALAQRHEQAETSRRLELSIANTASVANRRNTAEDPYVFFEFQWVRCARLLFGV